VNHNIGAFHGPCEQAGIQYIAFDHLYVGMIIKAAVGKGIAVKIIIDNNPVAVNVFPDHRVGNKACTACDENCPGFYVS
jgi:hypothetical protein